MRRNGLRNLVVQRSSARGTAGCLRGSRLLLFGDSLLDRVNTAVIKDKALKILAIGTTSSTLPGPDGTGYAYPARLEAALKRRLSGVAITVVTRAKPRQFASEMAQGIEKLLLDEKPNLVIWQTGTSDAVRGVDPEKFRASVADGVDAIQAAGADAILVNMQYSPADRVDGGPQPLLRQHALGVARARGTLVRPAGHDAALVRLGTD
jgi:hypothetical protein